MGTLCGNVPVWAAVARLVFHQDVARRIEWEQ